MGQWKVDGVGKPGILALRLAGSFTEDEMRAFVDEHNAAIDAFEGRDYRVLCDIRELRPLPPECTALFEKAKAYSSAHKNFQGSAVLVASKLVALQHQRTSVSGGVMSTELITEDEKACMEHLAKVRRG
jgi:hypothetical protein